jgi:hypothetical protein
LSKKPGKTNNGGHVADQVAEFIGRTMGELLNKKDALSKQLVEVDRQIADVRARVVRQFGEYLPAKSRPTRGRKSARSGAGGGSSRQVSPATRQKMAEAARKRWARERARKAKAAKAR